MTAARAAAYTQGQVLRCPTCGQQQRCVAAPVITAICTGGDRHRPTQMRPCEDADSREMGEA